MNGDGGQVVSNYEPPQLWFLAKGVLHRFEVQPVGDAVAIQLEAQPEGEVWPDTTRQKAYAWFLEHFQVVVSFEEFDAALKRDFPRAHSRMRQCELSEEAVGRDFANVHMLTQRPTPPVE